MGSAAAVSAALQVNFLVGSMMLEFAKKLGPIPLDVDNVNAVVQTYDEMERIRKRISEILLDYVDSTEEPEVKEECQ